MKGKDGGRSIGEGRVGVEKAATEGQTSSQNISIPKLKSSFADVARGECRTRSRGSDGPTWQAQRNSDATVYAEEENKNNSEWWGGRRGSNQSDISNGRMSNGDDRGVPMRTSGEARSSGGLNNGGDMVSDGLQQEHQDAVQMMMLMMAQGNGGPKAYGSVSGHQLAQEIATLGTARPGNFGINGQGMLERPYQAMPNAWGRSTVVQQVNQDVHAQSGVPPGMHDPRMQAQSMSLPHMMGHMSLGGRQPEIQDGSTTSQWQQVGDDQRQGMMWHHHATPQTRSQFFNNNSQNLYAGDPSRSSHTSYSGSNRGSGEYAAQGQPVATQNHPSQHKQQTYGNKGRNSQERSKAQGYRKLWQQVTAVNKGGKLGAQRSSMGGNATVEDLLEIIQNLSPEMSAIPAIHQGLHNLDAGALAALLKELSRNKNWRRAQEIFDWLRQLEPSHPLYSLCTTMTYTTMISQCGSQRALRRGLELIAEMRSRGVQCNVHTYSALMNVCIKAGELDLALDVYQQMLNEGCTPNLVTFNTLIDVYGKTGAWEEAIAVLDEIEHLGLEPEARTYNTVIIACNQSSRATEALQVYERMLRGNAKPTATTYTALISAYGKSGQLDAALQIFHDMVERGCERNVITYSSLISACEKAGRWELALDLFNKMHEEGCQPNVVTYNSLIAACAQGSQADRGQEIFDLMRRRGCRPDSVTFGALIGAYDRAGDWRKAFITFESIRLSGCRPDTVVYNTIIGSLWQTGITVAQVKAMQIFHLACRQGHFRMTISSDHADHQESSSPSQKSPVISPKGSLSPESNSGTLEFPNYMAAFSIASDSDVNSREANNVQVGNCIEFGMHAFTVGSAVLCLHRWLAELKTRSPMDANNALMPQKVALVLNKGKPSREHTYPAIKEALLSILDAWKAPLDLVDITIGCKIQGDKQTVDSWLLDSNRVNASIVHFLGASDMADRFPSNEWFQHEDVLTEARCKEAFSAVLQFESLQEPKIPASILEQEAATQTKLKEDGHAEWFSAMRELSEACCYPEDVFYDAYDILDRAMAKAKDSLSSYTIHALAAGCLSIAAEQSGSIDGLGLAVISAAENAAGLSSADVQRACTKIRMVLMGKVSSISSLRVIKLYLERLGINFAGSSLSSDLVSGNTFSLLPDAICSESLRHLRPSVMAASLISAGRKSEGITPFWPRALEQLTGLKFQDESELKESMVKIMKLQSKDVVYSSLTFA